MSRRVQVILSDEDREAFRRQASREGVSLSTWLREAGRLRLADVAPSPIRDADDLREFFASLPDRDATEAEPDWADHLKVIDASRSTGRSAT